MKFSPALILVCSLVCALGGAALVACSSATSDEQRVRKLVANVEAAGEARDVGDVLDFVSDDYADAQGNSRDSLALFLRGYFAAHPKLELVTSIDEIAFPVDGLARARVSVRGLDRALRCRRVGDAQRRAAPGRRRVARGARGPRAGALKAPNRRRAQTKCDWRHSLLFNRDRFEPLRVSRTMPDYRKPPVEKGGRAESAPLPPDSIDFSPEGTTMRLKSIRLARREKELMEQHRLEAERKSNEIKRSVVKGVQPSGRVRHDDRGMAVWDLAIATGEFSTLSATSALKKLDVGQLSIEETTRVGTLAVDKSSRDKGGGFDPYNNKKK
jgi:hypothetical protein